MPKSGRGSKAQKGRLFYFSSFYVINQVSSRVAAIIEKNLPLSLFSSDLRWYPAVVSESKHSKELNVPSKRFFVLFTQAFELVWLCRIVFSVAGRSNLASYVSCGIGFVHASTGRFKKKRRRASVEKSER